MLQPKDVIPVIERLLASGESRREAIIDAVAALVESDQHALKRMAADKAVSLALAAMRDDSNERLAFPSRNDEGERTVVHTKLTKDAAALLCCARRMERMSKSMGKAADRLVIRALQLDAFEVAGA